MDIKPKHKILFTLAFYLVIALLGIRTQAALAEGLTTGVLESLNEVVSIGADGSMAVKDVVTYDFGNSDFQYADRSIVTRYSNIDEKNRYHISNVAVTDAKGKLVNFEASTQGDFEDIVIGDPSVQFKGKQTFTITYQVQGAFSSSDDGSSSLYWNADIASNQGSDSNINVTVTAPPVKQGWQVQPNCDVSTPSLTHFVNCDSSKAQNNTIVFSQALVPQQGYFNIGFNINPAIESSSAATQSASGESIKSFDDSLKIQSNGNVNVQEKIVYDFGSNNKHGIYRNIPVIFSSTLGKLHTKITGVSVSDENNQPYKFTISSSGNDFVIKVGNPNSTVTGVKTYILNYTISRVINFFSDHDELYWNVTGNEWNVPIEHASAEVILPGQAAGKDIKVTCYAGFFGSTAACQTAAAKDGGAAFSHGNLSTSDGLTIVVGFPKGLVIPPTTLQKFQQLASDNWIVVVPFIVFIVMFLIWRFKGRDPEVHDPIVAQYEAPGGLSPAEAVELLKFSEPSRGVTAEIILLAVNGYLKINKKDKDYELIKLKSSENLPKIFQQTLLDGLFAGSVWNFNPKFSEVIGGNPFQKFVQAMASTVMDEKSSQPKDKNTVMLSDLEDTFYTVLSWVKAQISKSLIAQKLFTKDPTWAKFPYIVVSVVVGFCGIFFGAAFLGVIGLLSAVVSALIILLFGLAMPKRTLVGAQMAKQILGLKLYLNVAEKDRLEFQNAPEKTPERFEKLLPYAIALGVEKQWAKQFEGIYIQPPSWYNDSFGTFSTLTFVSSLNNFHSASSSTLASSPSRSSGGSGFSGGSSGGGSGGGGGGSW